MPIRLLANFAAGSIQFERLHSNPLASRRVASGLLIWPWHRPLQWWARILRFRIPIHARSPSQSAPHIAASGDGMFSTMKVPRLLQSRPRSSCGLRFRARGRERCNQSCRNSELVERRRA
jgi:hypothetical protein